MSSIIFKYIINRVFRDNQWNKLGVEDPYYEYVTIDIKPNGDKKYKKIPRRIPDGINDHDLKILELFKKKAYRYDCWFSIFGISFGWTNIITVIPVLGTIIATFWSLQLLLLARRLTNGFPLDLQLLILINIAIDFGLGLIPIIGSIIEIGYKANSRNYLLLEKHLTRIGELTWNLEAIEMEQLNPESINEKGQPFVEESLNSGTATANATATTTATASEQVLDLLQKRKPRSSGGSQSSSASSISGKATSAAVTTSNTTVTTSSYQSPKSAGSDSIVVNGEKGTGEEDSRSLKSIKSLGHINGLDNPLNKKKKKNKNKKKNKGKGKGKVDNDEDASTLMHHNVTE